MKDLADLSMLMDDDKRRRRPKPIPLERRRPKRKLTEQQVLQMRAEHATGATMHSIACKYAPIFAVSPKTIMAVLRRETWYNLPK